MGYKRKNTQYEWIKIRNNKPKKGTKQDQLKTGKQKDIPMAFDLLELLYEDESIQTAWWTGTEWDSRHPIKKMKIVAWRYMNTQELYARG